ncbi:MAG TPA: Trm112 family protein [Candidatus Acidoferrales bacterium]|nr:Trm112 family protein [Candidatus Acidoferrales bacterium]
MPLNEELLKILACPVCLTPIRALPNDRGLECSSCGRIYPIRDGFPIMLAEEATPPTHKPTSV